jgi:hypothetical protein
MVQLSSRRERFVRKFSLGDHGSTGGVQHLRTKATVGPETILSRGKSITSMKDSLEFAGTAQIVKQENYITFRVRLSPTARRRVGQTRLPGCSLDHLVDAAGFVLQRGEGWEAKAESTYEQQLCDWDLGVALARDAEAAEDCARRVGAIEGVEMSSDNVVVQEIVALF